MRWVGVSIPQAVSAVATYDRMVLVHISPTVSIPQAVSAVATIDTTTVMNNSDVGFNTASGKRRCNLDC